MAKFAYYRDRPFARMSEHPKIVKGVIYATLFLLYNAYFIGCFVRYVKNDLPWEWCDEFGFLVILTAITYFFMFYYHIVVRLESNQIKFLN